MAAEYAVKVDAKGRLSIPRPLRDALDIHPGDTLFVDRDGMLLRYAKAENPFDLLADQAVTDWRSGRTVSLRDLAAAEDVALDGE